MDFGLPTVNIQGHTVEQEMLTVLKTRYLLHGTFTCNLAQSLILVI